MIEKAAGIIVSNRKVLVERSYRKPFFISPGGKIESGESPEQALIRELKEECCIDVDEKDLEYFGEYTAEAINHPGQRVHMTAYLVKVWSGKIRSGSEVQELKWVNSHNMHKYPLGTILTKEQIPKLKEMDLVD